MAGLSFIARFMKMVLITHNVWKDYDDVYHKKKELMFKKREKQHVALQLAV